MYFGEGHAVDTASELGGLIQIEAGCEKRRVEEQPNQILHGLVRFVCRCLLLQLNHDGVLGLTSMVFFETM